MPRTTSLRVLSLLVLLVGGCASPAAPRLTVGATADPESLILAQVYAGALRGSGAVVTVQIAVDPVAELESGPVSLVPALTGRVLRDFQPAATARSDKDVYRAMVGALPEGMSAGDYTTAAEDKPAVVVTASTATDWGGDELTALSAHCDDVVVGAVRDAATPTSVGSCRLPAARRFPDEAALFAALRTGQITAVWTTTAAPGTPADLVVLADGKPALIPAENVVPLYRRNGLTEQQLLAVNQVAGVLDTAALLQMRRQVADGAAPQAVADAWLAEHPLGR